MKRIALYFLVFLLPVVARTQSKKELTGMLEKNLEAYRRNTLSMDVDSMLSFMPPAMFDIVPLDSLREILKQSMENEHFRVRIIGIQFAGKPKIKKADPYFCSLIPYDLSLSFDFLEENPTSKKMIVNVLKAKYGKENVRDLGKSIEIDVKNKNLIAYKDPAAPTWWFLEDKREEGDASERIVYEAAIPDKVKKNLQKPRQNKQ